MWRVSVFYLFFSKKARGLAAVFNKYFYFCVMTSFPTQSFVLCKILGINCDKRHPLMTNQSYNAIM